MQNMDFLTIIITSIVSAALIIAFIEQRTRDKQKAIDLSVKKALEEAEAERKRLVNRIRNTPVEEQKPLNYLLTAYADKYHDKITAHDLSAQLTIIKYYYEIFFTH